MKLKIFRYYNKIIVTTYIFRIIPNVLYFQLHAHYFKQVSLHVDLKLRKIFAIKQHCLTGQVTDSPCAQPNPM